MIIPSIRRLTLAAGVVVLVSACNRPRVEVYTVAKDQPAADSSAAPAAHGPDDGHDHSQDSAVPPPRELPQMAWDLPAGWVQGAPGQMAAANFSIKADGGEATVTITPLPNLAGREEMVVNMWRQQVGREPLSAEEVGKSLTPIEIAGGKGSLFEIDGKREGKPFRIITAMQHGRSGASWFYKLSGDESVVAAQKPAFLNFLKSIKFKEDAAPTPASATTSAAPAAAAPSAAPAPTAPSAPADAPEPASLKWTVPQSWQVLPAGQMQVAKFSVPEKEGAKAEVAVSVFPSDTGGMLANVNRWRAQLGLEPIGEDKLLEFVKPLEGAPEGAALVELPGQDKRIIGAVVPRDGRWWFYKMTGGAPAVIAARDEFVAFAKTQP